MIRPTHGAALLLPLVFAAAVLLSTAANRRDGRGPTVLTEREVTVGYRDDERTVSELWLSWSEPGGSAGAWLTRDALAGLGFDVSVDPSAPEAEVHYRRQLTRRAFVAFELDGPAWQAVLAERAAPPDSDPPPVREDVRTGGSRLVPVAVDLAPAALAQRYPDSRRHLITAAIVGARRYERADAQPYIGIALISLDPRRVQVPAAASDDLPGVRMDAGERPPFRVSLMYGRQWAPWVVAVRRGDPSR